METKKLELTTPVAVLASGILIALAVLYVGMNPTPATVANDPDALPVDANVSAPSSGDHIQGSVNAPIVLVEYSDFQCPFCSMLHPTLKSLVDNSKGQVAWVMRNYPLSSIHPQANPAANAAECIAEQLGSDGYFAYADMVFSNQSKLNPAYSRTVAQQLGANMGSYDSCIASSKHQSTIDAQSNEAQANGGSGTPFTVVVGGGKQVPISGAVPLSVFQSVISQLK